LFLHPVLVLPTNATDSPWVALTPCLLKSTQACSSSWLHKGCSPEIRARCLQPACENWVT
jgi:hypothetical protein